MYFSFPPSPTFAPACAYMEKTRLAHESREGTCVSICVGACVCVPACVFVCASFSMCLRACR